MLTKTTEYALRAATVIARVRDNQPALAKDIAREADIPEKYLSKVLRDLVRCGILSSTRGIGGGFRLRRKPETIKLIDVVRPFEDILASRRCPFGNTRCTDDRPCPIHEQWKPVVQAYRNMLENTTLADVAKSS